MPPQYLDLDTHKVDSLLNINQLILLVTATELETELLHKRIQPIAQYDQIIRVFDKGETYYYGKFGLYNIVHVQSSMGSMSRGSSIMTVNSALDRHENKIVLMIGIAYGADKKKQQIGDVLLSKSIIPYGIRRVGTPQTIHRGIEAPASKVLLNRFETLISDWSHTLPTGQISKLIPTRLLSGEELIDNLKYRNEILSAHPDSKGGEMEGIGVYSACDGRAEWILVKGICDFADGKKGKNKKDNQTTAMNAAISICHRLFSLPTPFKDLGISVPANTRSSTSNTNWTKDDILFDIYDRSKEELYIVRNEDKDFENALRTNGVWVSGPSGCGKSNLILRNILSQNVEFISINLAVCNSKYMTEFFQEILISINDYLNFPPLTKLPKRFNELIKRIITIIDENFKNTELVLFMEEIPISNNNLYQEFTEKITSFILSKALKPGLHNIRLVLSSINSPRIHIQDYQQKIFNHVKFIDLRYWTEQDSNRLIKLIESESQFELKEEVRDELLKKSLGSPRLIKKFYRNIFSVNANTIDEQRFLLSETLRDLNVKSNG